MKVPKRVQVNVINTQDCTTKRNAHTHPHKLVQHNTTHKDLSLDIDAVLDVDELSHTIADRKWNPLALFTPYY